LGRRGAPLASDPSESSLSHCVALPRRDSETSSNRLRLDHSVLPVRNWTIVPPGVWALIPSLRREGDTIAHSPVSLHYLTLKYLHASSAFVSLALFVTRGVWMMAAPERLQQRWVKVAPHVVDTILLASAIALVWPLGGLGTIRAQSWLVAKIVALLAYIVLGSIALKRGSTREIRVAAFFAAIAVFAYIVCVAVVKSAWGFVNWI